MPSPPPPSKLSPSSSSPSSSTQRTSNPVLRWFRSVSNPSSPPSHSPPHTPNSSSSSRAPSPLSALQDALSSDLPTPPAPAALSTHPSSGPSTHRHPHRHSRPATLAYPPSIVRSLTRTTLPTSSVSYPTGDGNSDRARTQVPTEAVESASPSYSPPTRTSIETLRDLHRRTSTASHLSSSSPTHSPTQPSTSNTRPFSTSLVPSWWWSQSENKEDVDRLLAEDDQADTAEQEQANMQRKYLAPQSPIVFCHGLLGFDSVKIGQVLEVTHWRGIKEVLEANGCHVLVTRVPATSSPADRAKVLERSIEEAFPSQGVHLVGHSMGGLDCRYLTSHLRDHTFTVKSVTTVATPHRGSAFADHFLSALGRQNLPSFLSFLDLLPNGGGDGSAFECLTLGAMREFNACTPDVDGVKYFSWGATYDPGLIDTWKWPHSVILEKEGPNDGLVSVESSKWGTYLGTLPDVNHLDLVGWVNAARYKWAELRGKQIAFKPATFYLGVADLIAREVEGQAPPLPRTPDGEGGEGGKGEGDVKRLGREVAGAGVGKASGGGLGGGSLRRKGGRRAEAKRELLEDDEPWDARSDSGSEAEEGPSSSRRRR